MNDRRTHRTRIACALSLLAALPAAARSSAQSPARLDGLTDQHTPGGCGPIRLDTSAPGMHSAVNPRVVADLHRRLHVLWHDYRDATWRIYYRRVRSAIGASLAGEVVLSNGRDAAADAMDGAIATDGADTVCALWRTDAPEGARVVFQRSRDGGDTWLPAARRIGPPGDRVWAPRLACGRAGRVYVCWLRQRGDRLEVLFDRSLDHGATWLDAPVVLAAATLPGRHFEVPSLACEPDGAVFVGVVGAPGPEPIAVHVSRDSGRSFRSVPLAAGETRATRLSLAIAPDGELYAAWTDGRGRARSSCSVDGGATWPAAPVVLSEPGHRGVEHVRDLVHDGRSLFVASVRLSGGDYETRISESTDRGGTLDARLSTLASITLGIPEVALATAGGRTWAAWSVANGGYHDVAVAHRLAGEPAWSAVRRFSAGAAGVARSAGLGLAPIDGHVALAWDERHLGEGAPNVFVAMIGVSDSDPAPNRADRPADRPPPITHAPAPPSPYWPPSPDRTRERRAGDSIRIPRASPAVADEAAPVAPGASHTLCNDRVAVTLTRDGDALFLSELRIAGNDRAIRFARPSGDWKLYLGGAGDEPVVVTMAQPGATSLRLTAVRASRTALAATWQGRTATGGPPIEWKVRTHWRLAAGEPFVATGLEVAIQGGGPRVHVAEVRYPHIYPGRIEDRNLLMLPWLGGYLIENPDADTLPDLFGKFLPTWSVPIAAYYGRESKTCLLYSDDDYQETYKVHNARSAAASRGLELRTRHYPADVFTARRYVMPYAVRVGGITGDWIDAARVFRERLAAETTWYHGPVGAATNPIGTAMRSCVATAQYSLGDDGDGLDQMVRHVHAASVYLGQSFYVRLYGAHCPDRFDAFYDRGYLPGHPTFAAAVREAQARGAVVAPYIQSTMAYDYEQCLPAGEPPSQTNLDVLMHAVRRSDGRIFRPPMPGNVVMCNGSDWWSRLFVRNAVDAAVFSHAHSLYLDYFGSTICYDDRHDHRPGGGTYPMMRRVEQVRRIREILAGRNGSRGFPVSMEAPSSRMTEVVDLTFIHPTGEFVGLRDAVSIPLFRHVHDNVKLSKIPYYDYFADAGIASWTVATEVLTFGQIPGIAMMHAGVFEPFSRFDLLPHYDYLWHLTRFLGAGGFLRWHNGTMVRPPDLSVRDASDLVPAPDPPMRIRTFARGALVAGMFRSPDGTLAHAITNPWVGPQGRSLECSFRFDPAAYDLPSRYRYGKLGADGEITAAASAAGPLELRADIAPGQIECWVFWLVP